MTLNEFVYWKNLQPADVIVIEKLGFRILDHYVVYLGVDHGEHVFAANTNNGVEILRGPKLWRLLPKFEVSRIRYFEGNEYQRQAAVQRAINLVGQKGYSLIFNNCEHYANHVQKRQHFSFQSQIAGGSILLALFLGLSGAFSQEDEEEDNYYA